MRHLVGNTPPLAYALCDLQDCRVRLLPGDGWSFEWVLVGPAGLKQLSDIAVAVERAGPRGMSVERLCSRLRAVTALRCDLDGGLHEGVLDDRLPQSLTMGYDDGLRWTFAQEGVIHAFSLRFLSLVDIIEN